MEGMQRLCLLLLGITDATASVVDVLGQLALAVLIFRLFEGVGAHLGQSESARLLRKT